MNEPDPRVTPPERVYLYLERAEAEALLPLLLPHKGRGALRYVFNRVESALQPPAYRWAVPDPLHAAADAVAALEDLWDHPHTYRAAQQELHRLSCALKKHGVSVPVDGLHWRRGIHNLLWHAGFRLDKDSQDFRLLLSTDADQWTPTGPSLHDVVDHYLRTTGTQLGEVGPKGQVAGPRALPVTPPRGIE